MFDGAGWFVGVAVVLFVFALLVVLLEAQSGDLVLWTGHRVVGIEQGGIVTYQWQGQNYSIDVPGYGSADAVSVYLDPGNPTHAMAGNAVNRTVVALPFGVPAIAAVVLLALGLTRRYRWTRRQMRALTRPPGYGRGLDPEFVARHLRQLRRGRKNVR